MHSLSGAQFTISRNFRSVAMVEYILNTNAGHGLNNSIIIVLVKDLVVKSTSE